MLHSGEKNEIGLFFSHRLLIVYHIHRFFAVLFVLLLFAVRYSCVGPMLPCVHLRKPQLRLHQEALAETAHSRGEIQHHVRQLVSACRRIYLLD